MKVEVDVLGSLSLTVLADCGGKTTMNELWVIGKKGPSLLRPHYSTGRCCGGGGGVGGVLSGRCKLLALVYDILPLEEGAGKRCSECAEEAHKMKQANARENITPSGLRAQAETDESFFFFSRVL